jgi:ribosomal-protein-alanine N-acetyltransferase
MNDALPVILETARVYLRRPVPGDLDDLFALYRDPQITRYIPDAPKNYAETREELEWFLNGHPRHPELGLWATIHKPSGQFIGRCGLLPWTIDGREEVEVAYTIARAYWGQGLATEVARALVTYGFDTLKLEHLICLIDPGNTASRRVAEKIGMRLEREVDGWEGDGIPFWIYALEKSAHVGTRSAGVSGV